MYIPVTVQFAGVAQTTYLQYGEIVSSTEYYFVVDTERYFEVLHRTE